MTENERKIKKRIQLIVAGSMAVFFTLVLTLVVQLSVMANQRKMENSLKAAHTRLVNQLDEEENKTDYYKDLQRFMDDYAMREFGYGRKGTKIFK